MNPGLLDRKITVETRTVTRDAAGGVVESWATHCTERARVQFNDGGESVAADRQENNSTTVFTVYYNSLTSIITTDMRILFESKYYNVTSCTEIQRHELIKINTKLTK